MAEESVKTRTNAVTGFLNPARNVLLVETILCFVFGFIAAASGIAGLLIAVLTDVVFSWVLIVLYILGMIGGVFQIVIGCSFVRCLKVVYYDIRPTVKCCGSIATLVWFVLLGGVVPLGVHIGNFVRIKKNAKLISLIVAAQQENGCKVKVTDEAVNSLPPFDPECILEVRHLRKCFPLKKTITGKVIKELVAVDDVSFKLKAGETLGIVGESGCGKTTAGRAILKLHQPTAGQIIFNGEDITHYTPKQMRELRKQMQIIFQDPYSSLPPRDTVGGILSEPVKVHKIVPANQAKEYVLELMDKCGLRDYYYERYPHEFSGGQRQRICIARALSVNPKLVICDEPVSALDVSIQAQIINLLKKLQREMNLAYVFISHDLSVVKFISDKIGVMYLGSMVEFGTKEDIFKNPLHPYTNALFSAVPNPDPTAKMNRIKLEGDIPSPANPPKGCRFHTRCPYAQEVCKHVPPEYRDYGNGHFAACHILEAQNG